MTARLQRRAGQLAFLAVLLLPFLWLANNTADNLARRGMAVGFDYLGRTARFPISESILAYSPTDRLGWAFVVGLANTLFLSAMVIAGATLLGFLVGLARRSRHPLAFGLASAFVDLVRNTPLVVQLLFWYAAVIFGMPNTRAAASPFPGVYLTDRGLYLPRLSIDGDPSFFWLAIAAAVAAALVVRKRRLLFVLPACAVAATVAWRATGLALQVELPELGHYNFSGGTLLTPELAAAVLGLTLYSSAFVAEIVRAGIDAVPRGQWEAARALGLNQRHTLRRIVLPQALRVILPPMTSQYVNITKNSTLALVVGYPELNFVTATTINQTGQALEGIAILMASFLAISLSTSLLMNRYNRRVSLVTR